MGFELWYSETSKIRRKGTSFLELKQIFTDAISTRQIFEPLDRVTFEANPIEIKNYLISKDFDVLGVVDKERTVGFVHIDHLGSGELRDFLQPIFKV